MPRLPLLQTAGRPLNPWTNGDIRRSRANRNVAQKALKNNRFDMAFQADNKQRMCQIANTRSKNGYFRNKQT